MWFFDLSLEMKNKNWRTVHIFKGLCVKYKIITFQAIYNRENACTISMKCEWTAQVCAEHILSGKWDEENEKKYAIFVSSCSSIKSQAQCYLLWQFLFVARMLKINAWNVWTMPHIPYWQADLFTIYLCFHFVRWFRFFFIISTLFCHE